MINTRSSAGPRKLRREWREKSDWSKDILDGREPLFLASGFLLLSILQKHFLKLSLKN
jgi:hypothetical protein